jgi:hypothetical protein
MNRSHIVDLACLVEDCLVVEADFVDQGDFLSAAGVADQAEVYAVAAFSEAVRS